MPAQPADPAYAALYPHAVHKGRVLSEARKPDRAVMAQRLAEAVIAAGAEAVIEPETVGHPFNAVRTQVRLTLARGLKMTVSFNGRSPQSVFDTYVLSWHMDLDSDARLKLNAMGYDSVNRFHQSKATQIANGFDVLVPMVLKVIAAAADGSIFDAEAEARHISQDGTAAERSARFAKWAEQERAAREAGA